MKKRRADERLFEELGLESLALARALIMEGRAFAGGRKLKSPGELVPEKEAMSVRGILDPYVSRGAHKLRRALEAFDIALDGAVCIDVGCSTGGFTDVMLRAGAARVYAVDVGYNVLDYRLRSDARVVCMERTNARFLRPDEFDPPPSFGATDVSFISLRAVLPAALGAMAPGSRFVALVKPQFEAPREDVGEKGVVRDPAVHRRVLEEMIAFVPQLGWRVAGLDCSPIRGPEGNIEFLLDLAAPDSGVPQKPVSVEAAVCAAYDKFIKSSQKDL